MPHEERDGVLLEDLGPNFRPFNLFSTNIYTSSWWSFKTSLARTLARSELRSLSRGCS